LELRSANRSSETLSLGDLLPVRGERLEGCLITNITIPLNARLAYEVVARTPADLPIVCVALARWPSGRVRLALGGYGTAPVLALDGPEAGGAEQAAKIAYSQAGDEWASAEYRQDMAAVLALRCLSRVESV
jgi:CO/xanthine dehydrogenase FAD-binding subunit